MSLLCKLFGHKLPQGWAGGVPYLNARGGGTDGIGREHWWLYAECGRCGRNHHFASVHGPLAIAPAGLKAVITYERISPQSNPTKGTTA